MSARLTLVLVLAVTVSCCLRDTVSSRFDTVQEARDSGFFERGWLPDVLPSEAGPIEERHDLDTNARCSRSWFPASQTPEVVEALRAQGFAIEATISQGPPWPACAFTRQDIADADIKLSRETPTGIENAAVDHQAGVLLFWSASD